MRVLHIIPELTLGGGSRHTLAVAKRLHGEGIPQEVISLGPAHRVSREWLSSLDVKLEQSPSHARICESVGAADVLLVHYWHSARLERLLRLPLPAARIAVWAKIYGGYAPQLLSAALAEFADRIFVTASASLDLPALGAFPDRGVLLPTSPDLDRLPAPDGERKRSGRVRVGYLGYVDFVKLHPDFVAMSSAVDRDVSIPVWGAGGAYPAIRSQASALGQSERFELHGPTEHVGDALCSIDIFGYPLCALSYATSDKSLQEAMYVGLPAVVFDRPGLRDLVRDGETAYVVRDQNEYTQAVTRLVDDADLRVAMGQSAKRFLLQNCHPDRLFDKLLGELTALASLPKRARSWPGEVVADDGAELFVDALSEHGDIFRTSLASRGARACEDFDEAITGINFQLRNPGAGGLFEYRQVFPADPYIAFWCGLALLGAEEYRGSLSEFAAARRLGLPQARVRPWVVEALARMRAPTKPIEMAPSGLTASGMTTAQPGC
jgi:glycosyltransferase involved in cell wall biosynthesis